MAKPALGRGLSALLAGGGPAMTPQPNSRPATTAQHPADDSSQTVERVLRVPVDQVVACPFQPRKDFGEETLAELADSIREQGILQPLIVRKRSQGGYELIAGERRWRAAQRAGLREVPVLVREADDHSVLELALIENLQRENLNPMEEALGYAELAERFQLRQEDVALKVGKSRAAVANALRLLKLSPEIQAHVREGRLSTGHAKVLLGLTHPELQELAAERVLKHNLSVRRTEELVAKLQQGSPSQTPPGSASARLATSPDSHLAAIQERLQERLGTKVRLHYKQGKGSVEVWYYGDDELDRLLQNLGVTID